MVKKTYLQLNSPVQYIKGIGPKRASYLKRLGIDTVHDLLFLIPRRYIDYSDIRKICDLKINDEVTIVGRIELIDAHRTRRHQTLIKVVLGDETGEIVLKWFNRPDLKSKFSINDRIIASGKVGFFRGLQIINPLFDLISEEEMTDPTRGRIIPVYPLTEGLSLWDIKRAMTIILKECIQDIKEILPETLRRKHGLMDRQQALMMIHQPETLELVDAARKRLVYDEFFYFELILAKRRAHVQTQQGISMKSTGGYTRRMLALLPFELTSAQKNAIQSILKDMDSPRPMNRLLQGDVGSGKTVVALYAMLVAVENGYQAALMAPTEILAEQHYLVLKRIIETLGLRTALVTSSITASQKKQIDEDLKNGSINIVLGTHALIERNISFHKLGLTIVDEQHRFGVMQRAALVNKGQNPDFLVLSATPIPRTMALTLYGDLDISTIKEKPPSRGEVITKVVKESQKTSTYREIQEQLLQKRQAFIICPIIERSEKLDLKSVEDVHKEIQHVFRDFTIGVIHGRLKTPERMKIMDCFRNGDIDILIATTVIEVGVDIPNATVMLIEHPERFGLAQLHQLRGRIGRGAQKSYCYLVLSRYVQADTYDRIAFFSKTNDGFALAQQDMALRGPGEILGKRQHGLPDIAIGDIERDQSILFAARDDAFDLISHDPDITHPDHAMVKGHLGMLAQKEALLRIG